jgi:excisionase family DNA binding protein
MQNERNSPNQKLPEKPLMLTVDGVAKLLDCSRKTVYRLADRGGVPRPVRLGGLMRWPRYPFEQWIADGCPRQKT